MIHLGRSWNSKYRLSFLLLSFGRTTNWGLKGCLTHQHRVLQSTALIQRTHFIVRKGWKLTNTYGIYWCHSTQKLSVWQTHLTFEFVNGVLTWRWYCTRLGVFLQDAVNALHEWLWYGVESSIGRIHRSGSRGAKAGVALLTVTHCDVFGEFVLPVPTN